MREVARAEALLLGPLGKVSLVLEDRSGSVSLVWVMLKDRLQDKQAA